MYQVERQVPEKSSRQRRKFPRYDIQCRARIRIGTRQYAGYLHNISQGGAKLRTISPIRKLGNVILRLPDLPPLRCQLRWSDAYNAGVSFELVIPRADLSRWADTRAGKPAARPVPESEIAELDFV
jgi:hypothetical protein